MTMKKLMSIAACALALTIMVAGMAFAEDGGFYGSVKAGYSYMDGSKSFSQNATDATSISDKFSRDGAAIGLAAGYNWMDSDLPIRTELEYMYTGNFKYKHSDSNATLTDKIDIHSLMLNVYWDFYNSTAFTPYINAGAGAAWVQEKFSATTVTAPSSNTSTNFAFNVGAGVGWSLTDSIILDLAYRYDHYGNGKKVTASSTNLNYESQVKNIGTHKALLGLRYQF